MSAPETLTEALAALGYGHGECAKYGCRQLTRNGADAGRPIDASTGWELVGLLRVEPGLALDAAIDRAEEQAVERCLAAAEVSL